MSGRVHEGTRRRFPGGTTRRCSYIAPRVYARNKHIIVNTSKSEVVHFSSAGENVPVFDVGGATLHHKDFLGIWAWFSAGP